MLNTLRGTLVTFASVASLLLLAVSIQSGAQNTVSAGEWSGLAGDTIIVAIAVDGADPFQAVEGTIQFDPLFAAPISSSTIGSAVDGWFISTRIDTVDAFIRFAAASTEAAQPPTVLLSIAVRLLAPGNSEIVLSDFKLNEGTPVLMGGQIAAGFPLRYGDVTQDGEITAFDAMKILLHSAFLEPLASDQLWAGDVTGNGLVTPYDASYVLRWAAGMIDCFPVDCEV
jgi:hypothetical protein